MIYNDKVGNIHNAKYPAHCGFHYQGGIFKVFGEESNTLTIISPNLLIRFNERVICQRHKIVVDKTGFQVCSLFSIDSGQWG